MRIRGFGNVGLGFSASKLKKRVRSRDDGCALNIKCPTRFSLTELRRATNDFSETHIIGSGSDGRVYKAMLDNGQTVTIKKFRERETAKFQFETEVALLSRLRHKNLLDLIGFCVEGGEWILVSEYIPNGSLHNILFDDTEVQLDWRSRVGIALQSARALAYLHNDANPRVIHRDIKPASILVDENLTAKVTNLGLAKIFPVKIRDDHSVVVGSVVITLYSKQAILLLLLVFCCIYFFSTSTCMMEYIQNTYTVQGYIDPQYISTGDASGKTDVYSLGVVLLQLITPRPAFDLKRLSTEEDIMLVDNVYSTLRSRGIRGLKEKLMDPLLRDSLLVGFERFLSLALTCLESSGSKRPSMREVARELESILCLEMDMDMDIDISMQMEMTWGWREGEMTSGWREGEMAIPKSTSIALLMSLDMRGR